MTNESLKKRVINDIDYIKTRSEDIEKRLISHNLSLEVSKQIQLVFDYFAVTDFSFISNNMNQEELLTIKNRYSPYKLAMEALINYNDNDKLKKFIEANSKIYEYIEHINSGSAKADFPQIDPENLHDELQEIYKRIDLLENKPEKILKEAERTLNEIDKLQLLTEGKEQKSTQIYENIQKTAKQTEQKAKELILNLEKLRDKEISVELAIQLENKANKLRISSFVKFAFFLVSILLLVAFNTEFINSYLYKTAPENALISHILVGNINRLTFWQVMTLKLSMNIPFFVLIGFTLNEYSKSNKLYEEYEFRRISAITLFNNYSRLINELNMEKEDLHESLKSSLDKIFDNPVHSIYGDKSGDKNIGLDQLEKIASILTKLKPNNP